MNYCLKILFFFTVIFSSCQKREWNNPFDPEFPKESWTPIDFAAKQQENAINLTWGQKVKYITGFRIERKIEGETVWKEVVSPEKNIFTWADSNITGGKLYEYRIVAKAGGNESNFATVQIKPLLSATLTTATPSAITATSAILGGTITSDGGVPISERGVCWATTTNPTTNSNKLAIGSGTGSFSNSISGLTANTTYYVRAYAINNQGTVYGNEITFKTSFSISLATLSTTVPSNITSTSATLGGNITSDGNSTIIERGVCYSTSQNPTTSNTKLGIGSGIGSFSYTVTGLTANTTYYVRAYAINSQGTAYGNQVDFAVGGPIDPPPNGGETVTDIEGNIYHTVPIGTQVWMVENLKTTKYRDGSDIPNVIDKTAWGNLKTPGYCWYNNDAANKNIYGALYNWHTVNTGKLAPIGWHIPSDAEWATLANYIGGESIAGSKLKEIGTTHWAFSLSYNDATNEYGFTALPGGARLRYGEFGNMSIYGYFWTSKELNATDVWFRCLENSYGGLLRDSGIKEFGFSIRCVKD